MYHNVVYDTISSYDTIIANTMLEVWPAIVLLLLSSVVDGHRAGVEVERWRPDDIHGYSIGRAVSMSDEVAACFFAVSVATVSAIHLRPSNQ